MHTEISNNKRKPRSLSQYKLTEAEVRDLVGAPTQEEEEHCICGERLEDCKEGYEHMTQGY